MEYDALLSEAEFSGFKPNGEVLRYIEVARQRMGLSKGAMKVLDWGSGRGEYVIWLRDAGYDAFGAEPCREASERGKELLCTHGHDFGDAIKRVGLDCRTDLPNGCFHFVFSHYVLEHVMDIRAVTREIARVTAAGGYGFHVYPGKLRLIEPHLFMPFVHWLPKTALRKWLIRGYIACAIEPRWQWLATADAHKKTEAYHAFCMNETFYRPFHEVRDSFQEAGLEVTSVCADHPALRRFNIIPRSLIEFPVRLLQTVEIMVRKVRATSA